MHVQGNQFCPKCVVPFCKGITLREMNLLSIFPYKKGIRGSWSYSKKKEFASLGFSEGTRDAEKETGIDKSGLVKEAKKKKKKKKKKITKYIQSP